MPFFKQIWFSFEWGKRNYNWKRRLKLVIDAHNKYKWCHIRRHCASKLYRWGRNTPFWYAGCRACLSGIPDAKGWYAGCHFWSKPNLDAMRLVLKETVVLEKRSAVFVTGNTQIQCYRTLFTSVCISNLLLLQWLCIKVQDEGNKQR